MLSKEIFTNRLSYLFDKYQFTQTSKDVVFDFLERTKAKPFSVKAMSDIWRFIRSRTTDHDTIGMCVSLIKEHIPLFYDDYLVDHVIKCGETWLKYGKVHQSIIFYDGFAINIQNFDQQPLKKALHTAKQLVKSDLYFDRQPWCVPSLTQLRLEYHLLAVDNEDFYIPIKECTAHYDEVINHSHPHERNYFKAALMLIFDRCGQMVNLDETVSTLQNFGGL